ncbi:MAG: hypothetical protein H6684_09870 [Deltaproteobacteria bacterium]|nr:hypothetical protein [Deltaproteobacteria bacterium]MCB9489025.1 hypothetical protein [Deltaproteobacteria bacterium]
MASAQQVERRLARQIQLLKRIKALELDKAEMIRIGALDALEAAQTESTDLVKEIVDLDRALENETIDPNADGTTVNMDRIRQLKGLLQRLAHESTQLTMDNGKQLQESLHTDRGQLAAIQSNKTALAGYKNSTVEAPTASAQSRGSF